MGINKKKKREIDNLSRSKVGLYRNLGSIIIKSEKDYDRHKDKERLRKETNEYE